MNDRGAPNPIVEVSVEWRCLECGASFGQQVDKCYRCFADKLTPVPWGRRPSAAFDTEPVVTNAKQLARTAWGEVSHSAYQEVKVGARSLVLVGGPGRADYWAYRFLNSVSGPVLLVSTYSVSPSLGMNLLTCNVKRDDFHVIANATCDRVLEQLRKIRAVACVIECVYEHTWNLSELRHLIGLVGSLDTLVAVAPPTTENVWTVPQPLVDRADVVVFADGQNWSLLRSRYQAVSPSVTGRIVEPAAQLKAVEQGDV